MSIDPTQLRELVIIPTLKYLSPEIPLSRAACNLLMMTAAHESRLGTYLAQLGGPAQGIYQMEPFTVQDIYDNYLGHRDDMYDKVVHLMGNKLIPEGNKDGDLIVNLAYATAIARVHYYRDPEPLPKHDDLIGLANYAKRVWNTAEGKATARDYLQAYQELVL